MWHHSLLGNRRGIWLDADLVCPSWNCGDCIDLLCFCFFFLSGLKMCVKHPYLKVWSFYFCFFPISFVSIEPQVIVVVPCGKALSLSPLFSCVKIVWRQHVSQWKLFLWILPIPFIKFCAGQTWVLTVTWLAGAYSCEAVILVSSLMKRA